MCRASEDRKDGTLNAVGAGACRLSIPSPGRYRRSNGDFVFIVSVRAEPKYAGLSVPATFCIRDENGDLTDEPTKTSCEFTVPDGVSGGLFAETSFMIQDNIGDWGVTEEGRYWMEFVLDGHCVARVDFIAELSKRCS